MGSRHDWWIYQYLISLITHGDVEVYSTQSSPTPLVRMDYFIYIMLFPFTF
jgi:hypothetical protein